MFDDDLDALASDLWAQELDTPTFQSALRAMTTPNTGWTLSRPPIR